MRTYLDHAASAPVRPEVAQQVAEDLASGLGGWANPSAQHTAGRRVGALLAQARALLQESAASLPLAGATLLGDLLVVRLLGGDNERIQRLQQQLWAALRPAVMGLDPSPPRIWST